MGYAFKSSGRKRDNIGNFTITFLGTNLSLPVKYSPVFVETQEVFTRVHLPDRSPIGRVDYCKEENPRGKKPLYTPVDSSEIVYVVNGTDVYLTAEERDQLLRETEEKYEPLGFASEIPDASLVDRTWLLEPHSDAFAHVYAVFREALRKAKRYPVGRVGSRNIEHLALVAPYEAVLLAYVMRYPEEVTDLSGIDFGGSYTDKEVDLAAKLLRELHKCQPFDYRGAQNMSKRRLQELIERKSQGPAQLPLMPSEVRPSLEQQLEASIQTAKRRKKK